MREYLLAIINEEIERAQVLKQRVQLPLTIGELAGLANRCKTILDDRIVSVADLRGGDCNNRSG